VKTRRARPRSPRRRGRLAVRAGLALVLACGRMAGAGAFESGRADFSVEVGDDLVVPYRVFAVYVAPSAELELKARALTATADSGRLASESDGVWRWTAPPEPGVAVLTISDGRDEVRLNALVVYPASLIEDGGLFGYRVGTYPEPLDGDPAYAAPSGFVALTADMQDLAISPHFRLGQFPSKQSAGLPKYLILSESLPLKLELLLERLNAAGVAADTFTVMSGFRTPIYNKAIGNGEHSRHIYGAAADIYVDVAPRDGSMDDLNGDGVLDLRDAQWLYRLADELFGPVGLQGGLGVYDSTSAHGPFLHVDARGRRARWGLLP
jgi:hypothetical protein